MIDYCVRRLVVMELKEVFDIKFNSLIAYKSTAQGHNESCLIYAKTDAGLYLKHHSWFPCYVGDKAGNDKWLWLAA